MNNLVEFSDHKAMEAEAAAWIARLDRGELSEEDRLAIRGWIDRSPEHYALISRLAGIWSDLDGLVEILAEVEPHTTTQGSASWPATHDLVYTCKSSGIQHGHNSSRYRCAFHH